MTRACMGEGVAQNESIIKQAIQTSIPIAKVPTHLHRMRKIEKQLLMIIGIAIAGMILAIEWIV